MGSQHNELREKKIGQTQIIEVLKQQILSAKVNGYEPHE